MATKGGSNGVNNGADIRICKDCKIPFPDIYAYTDHLESKQHIKGVMKKKYAEKYLAAKAKLDGKIPDEKSETSFEMVASPEEVKKPVKEVSKTAGKPFVASSGKDDSSSNEDSEDDEVYTCEICKKICTGLMTYKLHLEGKKHQKNVKKVTLLKEMKEKNMIPELVDEPSEETLYDRIFPELKFTTPNLECKVCKKKCLGPEAYKQHCKSATHQKKVAAEELLKGMEAEGLSLPKDQNNVNASFAQCDLCNKGFSGPMPYMQHLKSPAHLKQELTMRELGKIKDLGLSKEEDTVKKKLKCKECGKMFSGPVPFNTHLMSSAHGKKKKKSDLMDNLEKNHPEMIKTIAKENSDDSEDDSVFLGCKVCHMAFSGPEAANDHFTSSKHKNALKKKEMFKKFKQQQKREKLLMSSDSTKKATKKSESESDFDEEFDIIKEP